MGGKKKIRVAVTGLNAIDSPGPGVAVIRGIRDCKELDVEIIGLSYESLEPGIYMEDIADRTYQIPYPSAGSEALINRLQYIHDKEEIDVLIPNFDAELPNFIRIAGKLKAMGINTFLPTAEQFEAREKINLFKFCNKHNMIAPRDRVLYKPNELAGVTAQFGYPIVVKGKFYEATVCHTLEQATKAFHKYESKWGLPIIVQEFISGTEINVAALGDGTGKTISAVPMRKLFITDKGKAWAGVTLDDPSLVELAGQFIAATKWRGGFELEIMRSNDGKNYIMEINPRFPAWIYLTVGAGQNQPAALVKMALGQKVEPYKDYAVGKIFLRYSWDMIMDIDRFQQFSALGETAANLAFSYV